MENKQYYYGGFKTEEDLMEAYNIKRKPLVVEKKEEKEDETEISVEDEKKQMKKKAVKKDDSLEVIYADQDLRENIFKHIIMFTNDRDPKNNKTLKNVLDAIKELKQSGCDIIPELHVFVAADIEASDDESEITITDGDEKMVIKEQDNTDTLVFSRLGVQDEYNCEHVVKLLQDRGFLVLNPVQYSAVACNKYETSVLLQKANIPQPRFCLMNKESLYNEDTYNELMKNIYEEWDEKHGDGNEKLEFVVKILDGHGGTGVFLINGKRIYAVLQAMFAIQPELNLLIQKKEEADGGDIRVHVLTLRDKQVILAAMKRVKIGGDFRSNVSLGAEAEPIKLSKEQEQIALKTAKVSKLPWAAVDIMPLKKGSNKELGDNVVLEINASPGTDGISEVIKKNFINVLLSQLTEPKDFLLQEKTAGYVESVGIDWDGDGKRKEYLAKLDTGNGSKASHIEVGEYEVFDNEKKIKFSVDGKTYEFEIVGKSEAITGEENTVNQRYIVKVPSLMIGLRRINNIELSIVKQREKSTNVLINRNILSRLGYNVSSSFTHLLTKEMEKIKIV